MEWTMPAEWERHERTLIGWPTTIRVDQLWHDQLEAARDVHAIVARAVSRYEPVLMIANAGDADDARRRCGDDVEVFDAPIDDSWLRDSGPISVVSDDGDRASACFGFNAWGEAFTPFADDERIAAALVDHLGLAGLDRTDFILEGGSVAADGAGLLVTTERCLLNPNRNPRLDRGQIEARLRTDLGAQRFVWLQNGIFEDDGTDGHVDNVCGAVDVNRVILQGCDVDDNPNQAIAADNRSRLEAAGVDVVMIDELPYATVAGDTVPVPYGNFYVCNGAVMVPTVGGGDSRWLDTIGACFEDRDVVPLPGEVLAYGGGGVHCITQQVLA